jgi:radical SAM superfamily enzyme YgiQ (UPF0313 family)
MYRKKSGGLQENEIDQRDSIDDINFPDYNFIDLDSYIEKGYRLASPKDKRPAPVWVTRGCPYRCQFCSAPELNGKKVRTHSVEYMINWVKYLYYQKNVRWINILDDNFTFHVKYAKSFCRAIIELNLKGLGFGTPNGIRMERGDPELWSLLKQAGWKYVVIAPESGSEQTLSIMQKDLDLEPLPQIVRDIRKSGLKVHAFFIVGYPGESVGDIEQTASVIRKSKLNWVGIHAFQPLPGTPIFDTLVKEGKIAENFLPKNFLNGEMAYHYKELGDFNLARFTLRVYFRLILSDPLNVPYIFTCFSPRFLFRKLAINLKEAIFHPKVQDEQPIAN